MLCMIFCKYVSVCALARMHVCVVNFVDVSVGVCKSGCVFVCLCYLTYEHLKVILHTNAMCSFRIVCMSVIIKLFR